MAQFTYSWRTALDVHRTWQLITDALRDSESSPIWPHELSEIHTPNHAPLAQGTPITARYKFGSVQTEAHYRITRFDAPRVLQYETTDIHPLRGFAVISLNASADGGTHCTWTGEYKLKGAASLVSLPWFKLYFERGFFSHFIKNFESYAKSLERDGGNRAA